MNIFHVFHRPLLRDSVLTKLLAYVEGIVVVLVCRFADLFCFVSRILADPSFLYKVAVEQVTTIGLGVWWEVHHRGERYFGPRSCYLPLCRRQ